MVGPPPRSDDGVDEVGDAGSAAAVRRNEGPVERLCKGLAALGTYGIDRLFPWISWSCGEPGMPPASTLSVDFREACESEGGGSVQSLSAWTRVC